MKAAAWMQAGSVRLAGPARQNHQQGSQALAAAADNVFGHLVDQRDAAVETAADGLIYGRSSFCTSARMLCSASRLPGSVLNTLFLHENVSFDPLARHR